MKLIVYYQPVQPAAHGDPPTGDTWDEFKCDDWHQHFGCIHLMINGKHKHIISLANIRYIEVEEY